MGKKKEKKCSWEKDFMRKERFLWNRIVETGLGVCPKPCWGEQGTHTPVLGHLPGRDWGQLGSWSTSLLLPGLLAA